MVGPFPTKRAAEEELASALDQLTAEAGSMDRTLTVDGEFFLSCSLWERAPTIGCGAFIGARALYRTPSSVALYLASWAPDCVEFPDFRVNGGAALETELSMSRVFWLE